LDSHKQLRGNLANKKTGRNAFAVDCSKAQQESIPKEDNIMKIREILDGISKKDQVLPEFQRGYV
jgi:hypothetical protein